MTPTALADSQPVYATEQVDNIKDTIESLIIAFILAFVFRGFLVEAFVIPTGSMAPTLNGKHGTQICPDCGWEYTYGLPDSRPERDKIKCPNCGKESASHLEIPYHKPGKDCQIYNARLNSKLKQVNPVMAERLSHLDFKPQSGDRILVFKWPFALGGAHLGPRPWDVVVFKNPTNGQDNYIKRLVGKPNEVLEIIDGDVYTCPLSDLDEGTVQQLHKVIGLKQKLQHSLVNNASRDIQKMKALQKGIVSELNSKLKIRRKTETAQKALWHVVFHQDYLPLEPLARRAHWQIIDVPKSENRWDTSSRIIHFDGEHTWRQTIHFKGKSISDFYAYNFGVRSSEKEQYVGDIRMKFVLVYHGGEGVLALTLSKWDDVFVAEFMPDGQIVLKHQRGGRQPLGVLRASKVQPWKPGKPVEIEFGNLDYRVYVKWDGRPMPIIETSAEDYAPDLRSLRKREAVLRELPSTARISAEYLDIQIKHLALERDVFYKNSNRNNLPGWGITNNPIVLREGEYFVLGDNSPASQDSRLWHLVGPHLNDREDYQLGTVPEDQLIGKAFYVYWPSGFRIKWLPVLKDFGLVPNVGKMRWIR